MSISEYDYELPKELIAQLPSQKRDECRMMVLDRADKSIVNKHFYDITDYFDANDVLVLNNTKVIPARLFGKKSTGANIEVFLLKQIGDKTWEVLIKPSKRIKEEMIIEISPDLYVKVLTRQNEGKWLVELHYEGNFYEILDKVGNIPLPPYIERSMTDKQLASLDYDRYQTVYACREGSVAAPTAGLHFTDEILEKLKAKGVQICYVTLNVGIGTFRPVKVDNVLEHKMDSEEYEISAETARIINEAKKSGKRITAVGTTTVRTLESCMKKYEEILEVIDDSNLFIYPGFEYKVVDRLITNFHLPKSTLIMLVSAFAGKDYIFEAYKKAIDEKYKFYSYGDCMLIN
ncbi:MAG: tRNA preQ1(34) S-adenosylmethionine ribosyltransferase-isomerase QueA [Clostridium sp.]|nr:tRNA preQ1(34) S-adenosylmethionine ribosyltransferase-isomerase QueA [Clostridium sp.]